MEALQVAQGIYNSTIKAAAGKELELDVDLALQIATFCATLAQAEALSRIAVHLGNIHQALLAPEVNGEPTTLADQVKRIGDAIEAIDARGDFVESVKAWGSAT